MRGPVIAIIEYEPDVRLLIDEIVTDLGYETHLWSPDQCPWAFIQQEQPDLVILDLWLQRRGAGWAILNLLWQQPRTAQIPIIVCSTDMQVLQEQAAVLRFNGCETLAKPFQVDALQDLIARRVGPILETGPAVCSSGMRTATG